MPILYKHLQRDFCPVVWNISLITNQATSGGNSEAGSNTADTGADSNTGTQAGTDTADTGAGSSMQAADNKSDTATAAAADTQPADSGKCAAVQDNSTPETDTGRESA